MILDSKKSYYAVIPANIRYDEKLIPSAKLLYGEITALTNDRGYCWATNDYFSRLYSVSKKTISTWIKSLNDSGYIFLEFVKANSESESVVRLIRISENFYEPHNENFQAPITKTSIPPGRKLPYPHNEKVMENNTINNTFNISSSQIFRAEPAQAIRAQKFTENSSNTHAIEKINGNEAKKNFSTDSEPYLLARFLEKNISENNSKFPQSEAQRQRWAKDFDLMIRRDKIEPDDIAEVIGWCQKDSFWRSNILSGKKLREKYLQLSMKMHS